MARLFSLVLTLAALVVSGCALKEEPTAEPVGPQVPGSGPGSGEEPAGEGEEEGEPEEIFGLLPATTKTTTRLGGSDPIADAAAVAGVVFPATSEDSRPKAVVLVDSEDWQGGVAASVLAARPLEAPILLADGANLPPVSEETLGRLDPLGADLADDQQVIGIGRETPQPEGRKGRVLAGANPYALAAAIDRFSSSVKGEPSGNVIVTTGERSEFAMPAAAWAARSGDSILFTKADELPEPTRKAIREHRRPDIYIVGPESAVSKDVQEELGKLGPVTRVSDTTPIRNAVAFARFEDEDFGWGITAPGQNFTIARADRPLDAAAAAALAGKGIFAPLLLTEDGAELPRELEGYLLDVQPGYEDDPNQSVFNRAFILGDEEAVSLEQQGRLDEITELVPVDAGKGD